MDHVTDPNMANVYANESRIALCYGYKKQIDFMDTDLNLIKRLTFQHASPDVITDYDNATQTYTTGYFGKRYLYVVFMGTSWNEHKTAASPCGVHLEVFDLDGNPIARYYLDGIRPVHFAVDEETFTLYGPVRDVDLEDCLVVYKLKGLTTGKS